MTTDTTINTEEILMQIGILKSQIDRAEWEIGSLCADVKATLPHGQFTDFAAQVYRALNISLATLNRYMTIYHNFPKPIAQNIPVTTLYALTKTNLPEPVKRLCIETQVQSPAVIEYAARTYARRDTSHAWQELQASQSIALDGESVHLSEVTARDLKYLDNERKHIHAQANEYRVSGSIEDVSGNVITLRVTGGDDLTGLMGKEGLTIKVYGHG